MSINRFEKWTEWELKYKVSNLQSNIDVHKDIIKGCEKELAETQVELDRRAIEAYWTAHPELERVVVGDKLVITKSFESDRQGHGGMSPWLYADIIQVAGIYPNKKDGIQIALKGTENGHGCVDVGSVSIETVDNMRRAYLAQQQETN